MRIKKELEGKEFRSDMTELHLLLEKEGIKHELRPHPAVVREPQVKSLIGYYPTGEWQIIIGDREFSIIRGMASFGDYEIMSLNRKGFEDPARFSTPEELVKELKELP